MPPGFGLQRLLGMDVPDTPYIGTPARDRKKIAEARKVARRNRRKRK